MLVLSFNRLLVEQVNEGYSRAEMAQHARAQQSACWGISQPMTGVSAECELRERDAQLCARRVVGLRKSEVVSLHQCAGGSGPIWYDIWYQ